MALLRAREQSFIARQFEHRSGRIIALCRLAMASVFFLAADQIIAWLVQALLSIR